MKVKVIKLYGLQVQFGMYVIDFLREAGKTLAVTITEDNKISTYETEDLEIDFEKSIKESK